MSETELAPICAKGSGEALYQASPADYIWLAYSLFFLIEPAFRGQTAYWLKNIAVYLVFIAVYYLFHRVRRQRHKLLLLGVMAAMGLASISFNAGGNSFCIFAAALLPFVVDSEITVAITLTIGALLLLGESLRVQMNWLNIAIGIGMSAVVGASNTFIAQKKRANKRLNLAHEEIERIAAVAERERIARDLHDVLGHTLSVIVLKAELAGRLLDKNPQAAAKEIAEVESTARAALSEVREAIGGYRTRGLQAEIDQARRDTGCSRSNPALRIACRGLRLHRHRRDSALTRRSRSRDQHCAPRPGGNVHTHFHCADRWLPHPPGRRRWQYKSIASRRKRPARDARARAGTWRSALHQYGKRSWHGAAH